MGDRFDAWARGRNGMRVKWKSESPCCSSCLDDQFEGYGDDLDGCCCLHMFELEKNEHADSHDQADPPNGYGKEDDRG